MVVQTADEVAIRLSLGVTKAQSGVPRLPGHTSGTTKRETRSTLMRIAALEPYATDGHTPRRVTSLVGGRGPHR
jgi:hypothetical protein